MKLEVSYQKHELIFKRPAGTSRGVLNKRDIWLISIKDRMNPAITGMGECGFLPKLSIDDLPDFEERLKKVSGEFAESADPYETETERLPSIRFAFESALNDLKNGGKKIIFKNPFSRGEKPIPINGLVWMNDKESMLREAMQKVQGGYNCLKFKIGALDFDEECRMIEAVRKKYSPFQLEIRVDANGAFQAGDALEKLRELARFHLHSIEQPIKQGQWEMMQELCVKSPIKIALDEELIGIKPDESMLKLIRPHYLIFKPSLLGGFKVCEHWIELCRRHAIGWWITSALESNIGLNAIAQFTGNYQIDMNQGLGTGQLYENNFESRLKIVRGELWCGGEYSN